VAFVRRGEGMAGRRIDVLDFPFSSVALRHQLHHPHAARFDFVRVVVRGAAL